MVQCCGHCRRVVNVYVMFGFLTCASLPALAMEPTKAALHIYPFDARSISSSDSDDHIENRRFLTNDLDNAISAQLNVFDRIASDHRYFYFQRSLTLLSAGLMVGAGLANSSADREIHGSFQSSIRDATSDEWYEMLHANKELGNGCTPCQSWLEYGSRVCSLTSGLAHQRRGDGASGRFAHSWWGHRQCCWLKG